LFQAGLAKALQVGDAKVCQYFDEKFVTMWGILPKQRISAPV
jgi:hypothetical protein